MPLNIRYREINLCKHNTAVNNYLSELSVYCILTIATYNFDECLLTNQQLTPMWPIQDGMENNTLLLVSTNLQGPISLTIK